METNNKIREIAAVKTGVFTINHFPGVFEDLMYHTVNIDLETRETEYFSNLRTEYDLPENYDFDEDPRNAVFIPFIHLFCLLIPNLHSKRHFKLFRHNSRLRKIRASKHPESRVQYKPIITANAISTLVIVRARLLPISVVFPICIAITLEKSDQAGNLARESSTNRL